MSVSAVLAWPVIAVVRLYQRFVSPMVAPRCKYLPTCSNYALEALSVHGVFKGTLLATWRLVRCNPWSNGGVDYVPEKGHWKPRAWVPPEDWVGNLEPYSLPRALPMGLGGQWESDVYRTQAGQGDGKERTGGNLVNGEENNDVSVKAELVSGTQVPERI